jgi:high-affinity iron transporter
VWNSLQAVMVDLSETLPMDGPLGAVLSGLFGYQAVPVLGEVIAYVAFLAVSLFFFFRPAAPAAAIPAKAL